MRRLLRPLALICWLLCGLGCAWAGGGGVSALMAANPHQGFYTGSTNPNHRYGFQGEACLERSRRDPRIGRFLSVDPLAPEYPWNSPYAFSENRVIDGVELEGLEYLNVTASGIDVNTLEKDEEGGYNFSFRGIELTNVKIEQFAGQKYFNVGKDLYYGSQGASLVPYEGSKKITFDVNAVHYLFSSTEVNKLIDETKHFAATTDKTTPPGTGWCITWLTGRLASMYGGKSSDYGYDINNAMEVLGKQGKTGGESRNLYPSGSSGLIKGSGNQNQPSPSATTYNPSLSQSLVQMVGDSYGIFLFAISPGKGYHSTLVVLKNNSLEERRFIYLDNHGRKDYIKALDIDRLYLSYTNLAIQGYREKGGLSKDVSTQVWQLTQP